MSLTPYASVSAFIAHCRILRVGGEGRTGGFAARPSLSASPARDEIERVLAELSEAERNALGLAQLPNGTITDTQLVSEGMPAAAGLPSDAASRRRARAELKLHRVLAAHGLLLG